MNTTESTSTSPSTFSPNALRAIWQGIKLTWDKLGLILAFSLTGSLAVMLVLACWILFGKLHPAYGTVLGLGVALMVIPPLFAGACHVAHLVLVPDELSYADFWRGLSKYYWLSVQLGVIQAIVCIILGVNISFYLIWKSPFAVIALVASLYALILWLMMILYQYPVLIAQEAGLFDDPDHKAKRGAFAVLRRSLFLTLGSPLYSFLVLLGAILLTALAVVTAVLFVSLWGGLLCFVLTVTLREVLMKYGIVPIPLPITAIPDEGFHIPRPERDLGKG